PNSLLAATCVEQAAVSPAATACGAGDVHPAGQDNRQSRRKSPSATESAYQNEPVSHYAIIAYTSHSRKQSRKRKSLSRLSAFMPASEDHHIALRARHKSWSYI
ncbi:MAG TPA: hypothetical protein VGH96_14980, partial [Streptosporangiaceae bacterium]